MKCVIARLDEKVGNKIEELSRKKCKDIYDRWAFATGGWHPLTAATPLLSRGRGGRRMAEDKVLPELDYCFSGTRPGHRKRPGRRKRPRRRTARNELCVGRA